MKSKPIAAAIAVSVAASAGAMPVATFLAKAEALEAKGFTAIFSSDYRLLSNSIKADAVALRDERHAAIAARRTPAYCPPGPVKMTDKDILVAMRAVAAAERTKTETRDALRSYFARLFPCR